MSFFKRRMQIIKIADHKIHQDKIKPVIAVRKMIRDAINDFNAAIDSPLTHLHRRFNTFFNSQSLRKSSCSQANFNSCKLITLRKHLAQRLYFRLKYPWIVIIPLLVFLYMVIKCKLLFHILIFKAKKSLISVLK